MRILTKEESSTSDPGTEIEYAEKQWYVSNFETAVAAICEGIGYGWLPKDRIQDSLESGKLKILPLQESASYKMNFYLIRGQSGIANADTLRLAQALQNELPPRENRQK